MRLFILILTLFALAGCMMPMQSKQTTKLTANENSLQQKFKKQQIHHKYVSPKSSSNVPIVNLMAKRGGDNA